ncbi:MAG: carbonic anhydrase [Cellulomonadaceae bacterium]|nr:carbonic anhydrase [Cellulomonadaceae bacterium]
MEHPSQGVDHRAELSAAQKPFAVVFGCSDSRVAAEIIFDQGLGDLFVVRTAGHVVDTTVLGSIEYGVEVLGASLVLVLGHDSCGAVAAAADALATGRMPSGFVRAIVDRVIPSIVNLPAAGEVLDGSSRPLVVPTPEALGREHVRHTVDMLQGYSVSLATAIAEGRCAILGVEYDLADGRVSMVESHGLADPTA